jgi:Fur family ferric uptake transcriptional regulator
MSEQNTIGWMERMCRARRVDLGQKRRLIIRVLAGIDGHLSAPEVHDRVAAFDPRISQATVYRTLALFQELGLVQSLDIGDGSLRYERADKNDHHHLIELGTGRITEFENQAVKALVDELASELGYKVVDFRLKLYGVQVVSSAAEPADATPD